MQLKQFKMIDLTHSLSSSIPSWDGSCAFQLMDEDKMSMLTSGGTHMDAPAMFVKSGSTVDKISLHQLFGPACILDVSKQADADYQISCSDIEKYEATYGRILEGSIVIGFTGWERYWKNPAAYRNSDAKGNTHFPTFSVSAIHMLLERKISGVAIDTLALEPLDSFFPGHKLLLGQGKYIIENIANSSSLPPKGAYILALPLKIEQGSEAPARVVGFV